MAEGFDDFGNDNINTDELENYSESQLNDYFNEISLEKESLYKRHGDNENTPEFVRVKYGKYNIELNLIEEERDRRDYSETAWLDGNLNYKKTNLGVLKTYGTKVNINAFINTFITEGGKVNEKVKGDHRDFSVMFIRSFLALSDGGGFRPLLNNKESFELLKNTTFDRGGSINKGGVLSILKYRGVGVREVNVSKKDTIRKLNENSKEEKEYTKLVNKVFAGNNVFIKKVSKKIGVPENVVKEAISDDDSTNVHILTGLVEEIKERHKKGEPLADISSSLKAPQTVIQEAINDDSSNFSVLSDLVGEIRERYMNGESSEKISKEMGVKYYLVEGVTKEITKKETRDYYRDKEVTHTEHSYEEIKKMMLEKGKHLRLKTQNEKLSDLREQLKDHELFKPAGDSPFPVPEALTQEIIDSSFFEIKSSLHFREKEIESLVLTDQELREFTGILDPKGSTDTKIEALDAIANEYRLKALNEPEPRKEQLYNSIRGTAELKADFISVVEKGEPPKNSEAISILEEQINSNESANDISRLERFKRWIKDNWLGASALIITIASLLTTVIVSARMAIKSGAKAVKSFGQSVYKTFKNIAKKLGPIFGPVISAIGSLLSILLKYGAEGISWLAKNLWALVIAFAYLIYSRYQRK